jgi:hypothetical protein
VRFADDPLAEPQVTQVPWLAECLAAVASRLRKNGLAGQLFIALVERFLSAPPDPLDHDNDSASSADFSDLSDDSDDELAQSSTEPGDSLFAAVRSAVSRKRTKLLSTAGRSTRSPTSTHETVSIDAWLPVETLYAMASSLGPSVLSDSSLVIKLCSLLLSASRINLAVVRSVVAILAAIMSTRPGDAQSWASLHVFPSLLAQIGHLAKQSLCNMPSVIMAGEDAEEVQALLVDLHVLMQALLTEQSAGPPAEDTAAANRDLGELQAALRLFADPLLPMRAHGIRCLRALVLSKSPVLSAAVVDNIIDLCLAQLRIDDEYLYGTAVLGLAAVGDVFPERIMGRVRDAYLDASSAAQLAVDGSVAASGRESDDTQHNLSSEDDDVLTPEEMYERSCSERDERHDANFRVRIGEVLYKCATRCGDTLPAHLPPLLDTFLKACRVRWDDSMACLLIEFITTSLSRTS